MFTTFYYGITKKVVASFGTLFNNIYIVREDKKIKVPLIYSPKEKFVHRLKLDFGKQQFQTILPRMGFSISGLGYDAERKKNSTNRKIKDIINVNDEVSFKYRYEDVPYSIAFELYAYVRNIDDGLQIFEQIVPFFTPEFTITVKPQILENSAEEKIDIPIILKQTAITEIYDGSFNDDTRVLNFNMSFEAKVFYPGPVKEAQVIKFIDIDIFDMNQG